MADLRNTQNGTTGRNAAAGAITALARKVRIYDGAQPAADGAVTTQTLLWEYASGSAIYGAASGGAADLAATISATILANGTATWFRVLDGSDNILWDGSVGTIGGADTKNMMLTNPVLGINNTLALTSVQYTHLAQGV